MKFRFYIQGCFFLDKVVQTRLKYIVSMYFKAFPWLWSHSSKLYCRRLSLPDKNKMVTWNKCTGYSYNI